jgi:hypothetical protein
MANTTEVLMTTKDYFEIAFWIVSLLILCVTAYAVYFAPLKAVEIGRKLNDEQNQSKSKSDLFLTLFSLRGTPIAHTFVNALNQIDIVFQDEPKVLVAWGKYYDSLSQKNLTNQEETWSWLRTELLSEMAYSLGYEKLKQTDILKNYFPEGHMNQNNQDFEYNQASKLFFETGSKMHKIWIDQYNDSQNQIAENKKLDS